MQREVESTKLLKTVSFKDENIKEKENLKLISWF